jgi:hypothetical protein
MSVSLTRSLLVTLRRRLPEQASAMPAPPLGGVCFGPMSERDKRALKDLAAGDGRAADVLRWEIGDGDLDS